jgi:hypothetical protein
MNLHQGDRSLDNAKAALTRNSDLLENHIALALSWAHSITDETVRRHNATALLDDWLQRDSAAAMNYLLHSPEISEDMRVRIIQSLSDLKRLPNIQ